MTAHGRGHAVGVSDIARFLGYREADAGQRDFEVQVHGRFLECEHPRRWLAPGVRGGSAGEVPALERYLPSIYLSPINTI